MSRQLSELPPAVPADARVQAQGSGQVQDQAREGDTEEYLEKFLRRLHPRTIVVGVGGAGNNAISRLTDARLEHLETLAVNTDAQDLFFANSDRKLLVGKRLTKGLGAGNDPVRGKLAAIEDVQRVSRLVNRDVVFLACGLGGGTGTGATPIIAREAKKHGALVIALCTLPFHMEGTLKQERARVGLRELLKYADTVIPLPNETLLELVPDVSLLEGFRVMDEILIRTVRGIVELTTSCGLVNLDLADVQAVLRRHRGVAWDAHDKMGFVGMGYIRNPEEIRTRTLKALRNPFLKPDLQTVDNVLVAVTGDHRLSLQTVNEIVSTVTEAIAPRATLKFGTSIDPSLKGGIRLTVVGTCTQNACLREARALQPPK